MSDGIATSADKSAPTRRRSKFIPLLGMAALALFFTLVVPINTARLEQFVHAAGSFAPLVFCLMMIAGILVAPLPTAPLTLLSPKLFGVWQGLLLSLTSATIGAMIAFFIGRKVGEKVFERYPACRRLQNLLPRTGNAFAVFLLRLPPSPTFDVVSYLAGLTNISAWQFMLATFLGMVPVTASLCCMGTLIPSAWLWPLLGGFMIFWALRLYKTKDS